MKAISLLYGHDSRSGRQGYGIIASNGDVSNSLISTVEGLMTRLSFEARFVQDTPGYFALKLNASSIILGKAYTTKRTKAELLECRLILLEEIAKRPDIFSWIPLLSEDSHWVSKSEGVLPILSAPREVDSRHGHLTKSQPKLQIQWSLIAPDCIQVIKRWYTGLSSDQQQEATFIAPLIGSQNVIAEHISHVHFSAVMGNNANEVRSKTSGPKKRPTAKAVLPIAYLLIGSLVGLVVGTQFTSKDKEEEKPTVTASPTKEEPALSLTHKQSEEIEIAAQSLRKFVDTLKEFEEINNPDDQRTPQSNFSQDLDNLNQYLVRAEDSEADSSTKIKNLCFGMGEIVNVLDSMGKVSHKVSKLEVHLENAKTTINTINRSLRIQNVQKYPELKRIREEFEILIQHLKKGLDTLDVSFEEKSYELRK